MDEISLLANQQLIFQKLNNQSKKKFVNDLQIIKENKLLIGKYNIKFLNTYLDLISTDSLNNKTIEFSLNFVRYARKTNNYKLAITTINNQLDNLDFYLETKIIKDNEFINNSLTNSCYQIYNKINNIVLNYYNLNNININNLILINKFEIECSKLINDIYLINDDNLDYLSINIILNSILKIIKYRNNDILDKNCSKSILTLIKWLNNNKENLIFSNNDEFNINKSSIPSESIQSQIHNNFNLLIDIKQKNYSLKSVFNQSN